MGVAPIILGVLLAGADRADAKASVIAKAFPERLRSDAAGQVILTVTTTEAISEAVVLRVSPPPGFVVDPPEIRRSSIPGGFIESVRITPVDVLESTEAMPIVVQLAKGAKGDDVIASAVTEIGFREAVSTTCFLGLGLIGIALGWSLRILLQVFEVITPPSAAPLPTESTTTLGPIGSFVEKHYYAVDLGVALALGLIAMMLLMDGSRPPDTVRAWPGALTLGASFGALANTELFTRVKAKPAAR